MITRVREIESGGYRVTVSSADGEIERRETDNLAEAFAMQEAVQGTGKWPDGKEPGE